MLSLCAKFDTNEQIRFGNKKQAKTNESNNATAIAKLAKQDSLLVNQFFMKRANQFMTTFAKKDLKVKNYWAKVEFAPGRGQIHLHLLGIEENRTCLHDYYRAKTCTVHGLLCLNDTFIAGTPQSNKIIKVATRSGVPPCKNCNYTVHALLRVNDIFIASTPVPSQGKMYTLICDIHIFLYFNLIIST